MDANRPQSPFMCNNSRDERLCVANAAVQELCAAVQALIDADQEISGLTNNDLARVVTDPAAAPEARRQAAMILRVRDALADFSAQPIIPMESMDTQKTPREAGDEP